MRTSATLRTGALFAVGGIAFAGANLLLAASLPTETYGRTALVVALMALGSPIAPMGLATIAVRERLPADVPLLLRCLMTSTVVGIVVSTAATLAYGLTPAETVAVTGAVIGGGVIRVAAARLQGEERFVSSTLLSESANPLLLAVAMAAAVVGSATAAELLGALAVAQAVLAGLVWRKLIAADQRSASWRPIRLMDAALLTGTSAAALVMLQLARLTIPLLLDFEALARFAVVAAVAVAPLRLVQVAVGRTILPRLRNAPDVQAKRRLLRAQAIQVLIAVVVIGVVVVAIVPPVLHYMLKGDYGSGVVLASVAGAAVRVLASLTGATLSALAATRSLAWWNAISWLTVLIASLGAAFGSTFGLTGLLWGMAAGSSIEILLSIPLIVRLLR